MFVTKSKCGRGPIIGAAMISAAMLWALPSANAADGGGCTRASGQGFRITSCISAHYFDLIPDYYIDAVPDPQRGKCAVVWRLFQDKKLMDASRIPNGDFARFGNCVPGHVIVPTPPWWKESKGAYYLEVQVLTKASNGAVSIILKADSPVSFI
jgi:hypothetical protein